ncbi:polyphosphate kinase 2 family protein [Herbiconiux moechotypicola]|uniref:Polyphosphate kinase 2 family protein n=1 Tax=Herbiconiux moechotypicola TaxID=637393 RepID=A0ABP5R3G1_9MICO|nr:PPK2 family polyphosphate kinase [Herbiconiux moechotypicola]MCS5731654.1 polyphosphate kinase 2 family protein [Herbiconiux moechotypicola]
MSKHTSTPTPWSDRLRAVTPVDLASLSSGATPGVLDKEAAATESPGIAKALSTLQEKLFADSLFGGRRRVLLVLQGMDTAGKGGVVKRVAGTMDPQGISHHAFKKPTEEELAHPFLWRVEKRLPGPGSIGIFDRSHYEDVLVPRVHESVPSVELESRYEQIVDFERALVDDGVAVLKVFLHLGFDEQKKRLLRRLDRSDKHWKFSTADVDDRALWPSFHDAYEVAIDRTHTSEAPWHIVPADNKWYSALAVQNLLLETLQSLDLTWPTADYDVAAQRARLLAT